jgi:hypothetical protein
VIETAATTADIRETGGATPRVASATATTAEMPPTAAARKPATCAAACHEPTQEPSCDGSPAGWSSGSAVHARPAPPSASAQLATVAERRRGRRPRNRRARATSATPVRANAAAWNQPSEVRVSALGQGTPWWSRAVQPQASSVSCSAMLTSAATARNSGPVRIAVAVAAARLRTPIRAERVRRAWS